ncbi:hypothetical protein [Mucilaginibacter mallensis]|nr:hypothetical protein [Mucilaginibacter mallensis]
MNNETITFNQSKLDRQIDKEWQHTVLVARHDESFVLTKYIGNSLYTTYTYFGDIPLGWRNYKKIHNTNGFINGFIKGICLSDTKEDIYYIYAYELR